MPIYEYICESCGQEFEELQHFSDPPVTTCLYCEQRGAVQRKISAPAFHLQGGGWYSDGYSGKGDGKKDKTAADGSGSTDKSSTESSTGGSDNSSQQSSGASKEAKKNPSSGGAAAAS